MAFQRYPCINDQTDYGIAIAGLSGAGQPVFLAVDTQEEPDPRQGQLPSKLTGIVTVSGLTAGRTYTLYRYRRRSTRAAPRRSLHEGRSTGGSQIFFILTCAQY